MMISSMLISFSLRVVSVVKSMLPMHFVLPAVVVCSG